MKIKRQYKKRCIVFSYINQPAFVAGPMNYPEISDDQLLEMVEAFYNDIYGDAATVQPIDGYLSFLIKTPMASNRLTWSWMPTYSVDTQKTTNQ